LVSALFRSLRCRSSRRVRWRGMAPFRSGPCSEFISYGPPRWAFAWRRTPAGDCARRVPLKRPASGNPVAPALPPNVLARSTWIGGRASRTVNGRRQDYIVRFAAVLLAFPCTFGLILLLRSFYDPTFRSLAAHKVQLSSSSEISGSARFASVPWSQLASGPGSEPNVLELPKASFDFVGIWGGYTHAESSDVESPDHISVVFGRRGDT